MPTHEEAKRAFLNARASHRRKRLRELTLALLFGILCSGILIALIYFLNRPHRF